MNLLQNLKTKLTTWELDYISNQLMTVVRNIQLKLYHTKNVYKTLTTCIKVILNQLMKVNHTIITSLISRELPGWKVIYIKNRLKWGIETVKWKWKKPKSEYYRSIFLLSAFSKTFTKKVYMDSWINYAFSLITNTNLEQMVVKKK